MSEKGVEISRRSREQQVVVRSHGIEIQRRGKPVSTRMAGTGYVYLVIDCSGSMQGNKLDQAKKGALRFAKDALSKGYATGLIQFHSSAIHLSEPTKEIPELERQLVKMEAGGSTNMGEAIRLAHRRLVQMEGLRAMVIATDGMPDSVNASLKAGQDAKRDGIDIITIGTDDADQNFLRKLSSRAELAMKVSREQFERGIASSVKMLPANTKD